MMFKNSKIRYAIASTLLVLGAMILLLFIGWAKPSPAITITIGNEVGLNAYGQGKNLYNFFGWSNPSTVKGKTARRMEPVASLMIPYAQRLGSPQTLDVMMCGCGSTIPISLTINQQSHRVSLRDDWEQYHFAIPTTPTIYEYSLYLEWQGEPVGPAESGDAVLLPLVQDVTVRAERPDGFLMGILFVGVMLVIVFVLGASQPAIPVLIWGIILMISAAMGQWFYSVHLLSWFTIVLLGGSTAIILTVICPNPLHRLLLWGVLLWVLWNPLLSGSWILDDAFISFRYARNLVDGAGLTFNPGGEIVEGYTNFLWTIIIAAGLALGFEPVLMTQVFCTGLSLATILLVYRMGVAWWGERIWALFPPLILASIPSYLLYTTRGSGMESALITLLATMSLWLLWQADRIHKAILAGVMCGLVTMTRPDGILVLGAGGVVMILTLILQLVRPGEKQHQSPGTPGAGNLLRIILAMLGGFSALYGPYFLWRWSYYGYVLPNTFYAKTGATIAQVMRGFDYSRDFVMSMGLRSVVIIGGLSIIGLLWPGAIRKTTRYTQQAWFLWMFILLTLIYVTLVGGDHFPLWRFYVPILPAIALLATHGLVVAWDLRQPIQTLLASSSHPISPVLRWLRWLPVAGGGGAILLMITLNTMTATTLDSRDIRGRIWGEHYVALKNREVGLWLRFNTPPDTVIATGIAGALPYYAHRHVLDALGLNNLHIAHLSVETIGQGVAGAEKTDPVYILSQHPDYIPHASSGAFAPLEQFQQEYERISVRGPEGGEILLYRRITP